MMERKVQITELGSGARLCPLIFKEDEQPITSPTCRAFEGLDLKILELKKFPSSLR